RARWTDPFQLEQQQGAGSRCVARRSRDGYRAGTISTHSTTDSERRHQSGKTTNFATSARAPIGRSIRVMANVFALRSVVTSLAITLRNAYDASPLRTSLPRPFGFDPISSGQLAMDESTSDGAVDSDRVT
ncbi:MAG TPA: hypothetical protein DCE44_06040, partial [Verrucomicrobiales bacterium]|nr:hypothetical protein [Verrucomicrobiales bacterium]